jgi:hypothetical protein
MQERIQELNGTLTLTSAPGQGTSLCVCSPLLKTTYSSAYILIATAAENAQQEQKQVDEIQV